MAHISDSLQVTLAPDGFYPCSLRWQGRRLRVLYVEEVYTRGQERRYRLRTTEGAYEIGFVADAGRWQMHRAPSWGQRWWARVQATPRFPAPADRCRSRKPAAAKPETAGTVVRQPLMRPAAAAAS